MRVIVSQFEGIDATPVLPLAAGCLVATARADAALAGTEFAIALERQAIDRVVAGWQAPDLIGLSLYPWNAAYSLAVAAAARAAFPDALIVAGGPAVPRRPERARRFLDEHPGLDVLVFAEGELTFRE
ncbi:MAG TPA: cobalamin-dependent protein, partial [Kofleriaceae bacterium]|nr:cobalamin-dependent protein [Kofleriaceae bacterium]